MSIDKLQWGEIKSEFGAYLKFRPSVSLRSAKVPNIPLVDGFGLNVQASPSPASAFAKYFNPLPSQ